MLYTDKLQSVGDYRPYCSAVALKMGADMGGAHGGAMIRENMAVVEN